MLQIIQKEEGQRDHQALPWLWVFNTLEEAQEKLMTIYDREKTISDYSYRYDEVRTFKNVELNHWYHWYDNIMFQVTNKD